MRTANNLFIQALICGFVSVMLFFSLNSTVFSQSTPGDEKYKLKRNGKDYFTIKKKNHKWKVSSPGITLKVTKKENGFKLKTSSQEYFVKRKKEKFKIYTADNVLLYKIKHTSTKLKIYQGEDDGNPISIALKDDGLSYKVKKGNDKIGKIKFYGDKSKIKVKNIAGDTLCEMKSPRLRAGGAVCLFDEFSEEHKLILFALLMIIGE